MEDVNIRRWMVLSLFKPVHNNSSPGKKSLDLTNWAGLNRGRIIFFNWRFHCRRAPYHLHDGKYKKQTNKQKLLSGPFFVSQGLAITVHIVIRRFSGLSKKDKTWRKCQKARIDSDRRKLTSLMMMVPSMASFRSVSVCRTAVITLCIRSISCLKKIFMGDSAPIFCNLALTWNEKKNKKTKRKELSTFVLEYQFIR